MHEGFLQVNLGLNPIFWLLMPLTLALRPKLVLIGLILLYILPRGAQRDRSATRFTASMSAEDLWSCFLAVHGSSSAELLAFSRKRPD